MNEEEAINAAHVDVLKELHTVLFQALTNAKKDADATQAEKQFEKGLKIARVVRDRAMAILRK